MLPVLLILAGCDGAFKVRGTVQLPDGSEPADCKLHLYSYPEKNLVNSREITPKFQQMFVIAPWEADYSLGIECADARPFFSRRYTVSTSKYYETPLDLGRIVLVPTKQPTPSNCKAEPILQNVPRIRALKVAEGERYRRGPYVSYVIRRDGSIAEVRLLEAPE